MAWTVIDLARDEKVRGRLLGRESSARGGA
jgi:hypothetical protein